MKNNADSHTQVRAFTLIEMLVVIAIMATLISVGLVAGSQIFTSSKATQTKQLLAMLDRSLTEYISVEGSIPPAFYDFKNPTPTDNPQWTTTGQHRWIPVVDGVTNEAGTNPTINSVGWYLRQVEHIDSAIAPIRALPNKVFVALEFQSTGGMEVSGFPTYDVSNPANSEPNPLPTVLDGWGNPIRYVHPAFQGVIYGNTYPAVNTNTAVYVSTRDDETTSAIDGVIVIPPSLIDAGRRVEVAFENIRRSPDEGDADGGLCANNRPYFYSAGPDGDPSTLGDNVYLTEPRGFQQ